MLKDLDLFFSNRLDVLYQHLKNTLFNPTTHPMMRRLVVVYGPAMKTWLMLKMAQDPDLNVATGIEFIYLNQAFESLIKLTVSEETSYIPSSLELSLAIEKELLGVVQTFENLGTDEQYDWMPLIQYLKLHPYRAGKTVFLSRKMEKRLISLSQHLTRLFHNYGRYAYRMVTQWELPSYRGWQPRLWRKLFADGRGWTYPAQALQKEAIPKTPFTLHFFSISFITACEFTFLRRLAARIPVSYYLLSPCAVFWSDIRSDRENAYLQKYWQQKLGAFSPHVLHLEEFLRDRNPLLANFGHLGREMAHQIEESQALIKAHYVLPQHVQALDDELFINDDLFLTETKDPLSLLHAIQADLLMMRNPQGRPLTHLQENKRSLQLHIASNLRREVQILYHQLLGLMAQDPSLCPNDIIVMAPQISDYVPYIQSIFGLESSQLDFQVLDLGMQTHSEIVQAFLQLLTVSESRWDAIQMLQLFGHPSFQRQHQLNAGDHLQIQEWIEQVGIRWGNNEGHRNELLLRRHCEQGMVEETTVGTWDYGLNRLLLGLTTVLHSNSSSSHDTPPYSSIDFSQGDLLEKWIRLLHSLRDDLSPMHDRTQMTVEDWMNYFVCLLENYFKPDFENPESLDEYEDLKAQFEILRASSRFIKDSLFSFPSIKSHLFSLFEHRGITYREDHLQTVRFCSLMPLRSIPAKVIALLGMQEEAFPRTESHSSLNMMTAEEHKDYCPSSTDYDRYLFLEALHSAQEYLIISYAGYHPHDSKELQPSLVVQELFSYLDTHYTIQEEKISKCCIFRHPFDAFDERYFRNDSLLHNYSPSDFRAAQTYYKSGKHHPHRFLNDFTRVDHPQSDSIANNSQIDLKHLTAAVRNPIKFHLNKVLDIYLQNEEDRKLKTEEELFISSWDKYLFKQFALKEPLQNVLHRAENEGKLPFGLFKTVAIQRLKEEVEEIHERLQKYAIDPASIFQIEFCTSCSQPTQIEQSQWLFPAISLSYEDGYQLSIIGKLSHATPKGLLVLSKGTLADAWRAWPQFLLYCYAAKLLPQQLEPQLILAHAAQSKQAFFDDPEPYLKQLLNYYALCLRNFSPLLPEWIPLILEEDVRGLEAKMQQLYTESFGVYHSQDLRWILNKHRIPNAETLIYYWKPQAELLLNEIIRFWYSPKPADVVKNENI